MRIHGKEVIHRRTNIPYQSDYHKYVTDLRKDFYNMCGYCGKYEMISLKGMEPDHFVPDKIDHSRKCDYSNLVYSCFTCNRKKLGKWPTNNKDKPHDGKVGLVDPATEEYDQHLGRSDDGTIEYYTDVGKYMYQSIFKFDIRPTKSIWQASQLYKLISELKKKDISYLLPNEKEQYLYLVEDLLDLKNDLFEKDE